MLNSNMRDGECALLAGEEVEWFGLAFDCPPSSTLVFQRRGSLLLAQRHVARLAAHVQLGKKEVRERWLTWPIHFGRVFGRYDGSCSVVSVENEHYHEG